MAAKKIRIHKLAKELGMTNQEVLDLCGVLGVIAKGPSSSLAEAYSDMVARRAYRDGLTRDEQPEMTRAEANRQKQERAQRAQMERPEDALRRKRVEQWMKWWEENEKVPTLRMTQGAMKAQLLYAKQFCPSCGVRPDPLSGACRC